jgi:nicotinamidase-related amidase
MADELFSNPLGAGTVHLCVDMQHIFSSGGPWAAPWMGRVLPVISEIASRFPERTIFTRFITPPRPEDMPGMWRRYYERWRETTLEHIDPRLLELVDPLGALAPPATVVEKSRYSAFVGSQLLSRLRERDADTLVVTGSETDVCVLATVLDAVDLGYRVVFVRDAVCSSSDEGHDVLLKVYHGRYSIQIETADAQQILRSWR